MKSAQSGEAKRGYCIFVEVLSEGAKPLVRGSDGKFVVFETELEAQREIADHKITELQEFIKGYREFEEVVEFDEFVLPIKVRTEGVEDEDGRIFRHDDH